MSNQWQKNDHQADVVSTLKAEEAVTLLHTLEMKAGQGQLCFLSPPSLSPFWDSGVATGRGVVPFSCITKGTGMTEQFLEVGGRGRLL